MDIRHPLKELDLQLIEYCSHYQLPVHILLNKHDKLSKSAAGSVLLQVRKALVEHQSLVSVQLFSALRSHGLDELKQTLNQWFQYA
jgi:GTP-binding protein